MFFQIIKQNKKGELPDKLESFAHVKGNKDVFDDFSDSFCVFLPHLKGYEGWICQNKIKIVVILLWNQLGMVEVVLEKIRVFISEFFVILYSLSKLRQKVLEVFRD